MQMNKWIKIAITVAIIMLSAVIGMQFGATLDHAGILGEIAWNVNLMEVTGVVFAIAAASGCLLYFTDDKK